MIKSLKLQFFLEKGASDLYYDNYPFTTILPQTLYLPVVTTRARAFLKVMQAV